MKSRAKRIVGTTKIIAGAVHKRIHPAMNRRGLASEIRSIRKTSSGRKRLRSAIHRRVNG